MFNSGGRPLPVQLVSNLSSALQVMGRGDISEQMPRVIVPPQMLAGTENAFSFLAYPWPRLTYEQRCAIDFRDFESVVVKTESAIVQIDLDNFGQVNWLKIACGPTLFEALNNLVSSVVPQ